LALRHGEFALTIPAAPQEGKATYFNSLDILDTGDLKTKKMKYWVSPTCSKV
jgi:hypothetical protein